MSTDNIKVVVNDIKEFAMYVSAKVKEELGVEVTVREVNRNHMICTDLCISTDDPKVSVSGAIDPLFKAYLDGMSIDEAVSNIIDSYLVRSKGESVADIANIMSDLTKVTDKIYPRLVCGGDNPYLYDKVYTPLMDMAIVYTAEFSCGDGVSSVTITEEMLSVWGVTKSYIHEIALRNISNRDIKIDNINDLTRPRLIVQLMSEGFDMTTAEAIASEIYDANPTDMWVVSNTKQLYGASMILSSRFEDVVREHGGDVYVIPSSVHEVLIVPVKDGLDDAVFSDMISDVNNTAVPVNEVLSNTLYRYSLEDGLSVAVKGVAV